MINRRFGYAKLLLPVRGKVAYSKRRGTKRQRKNLKGNGNMQKILRSGTGVFVILGVLSTSLLAQEMPPEVKPAKEHKWLKKFEGSWNSTAKTLSPTGEEGSPMVGTIEGKMIGEFWVTNTMSAKLGEFEMKGLQTIGYDKKTKSYVGTWIDSTGDFVWKYKGSVDKTGKILSLLAEGPDMTKPGKMAMYRDMYEFISDDEVRLTSSVKGPEGKWIDFMKGTSTRKK